MMGDRTSVALGSFDGLHCGHQAVLQCALHAAGSSLQPCVLLFDAHPLSVLRGTPPPLLMQNAVRDRLLRDMGFRIETVSFAHIRELEPDDFVRSILRDLLHAGSICCGYNYRFGKGGRGDASQLQALCERYGMQLHIASPVLYEGEAVSSTRIRRTLESGGIEAANRMLGRPFLFAGTVIHGNENGRALGYPTANQLFPAQLVVPKFGVYASTAQADGRSYRAITNIGTRPTLSDDTLLSETHILGTDSDLYGRNLTVFLHRFIRPERRFETLADVFRQVRLDIAAAYPDTATGSEEIQS